MAFMPYLSLQSGSYGVNYFSSMKATARYITSYMTLYNGYFYEAIFKDNFAQTIMSHVNINKRIIKTSNFNFKLKA